MSVFYFVLFVAVWLMLINVISWNPTFLSFKTDGSDLTLGMLKQRWTFASVIQMKPPFYIWVGQVKGTQHRCPGAQQVDTKKLSSLLMLWGKRRIYPCHKNLWELEPGGEASLAGIVFFVNYARNGQGRKAPHLFLLYLLVSCYLLLFAKTSLEANQKEVRHAVPKALGTELSERSGV